MLARSKPEAKALLAWYDRHRRQLPWRSLPGQTVDPYRVWLSEVMLQQTTVPTVKGYYEAFLARWPTLGALAGAPDEAVMAAWAGLGYYSRARNLLACARAVVSSHGGQFPADEAALRALPGIGDYTAAAIVAIAFGRRAVVIDGNVERVVARLAAIEQPLPGAKVRIRAVADALTPEVRAGDFAQAMMDLGATICTPKNPSCLVCPLAAACAARARGIAQALPVKAPKKPRPARHGVAFVVVDGAGRLLVRTRPAKGLLGGMTEVPGTPWLAGEPSSPPTVDQAPLPAAYRHAGTVFHVFTHFSLELTVFTARIAWESPAPPEMRWLDSAGVAAAPWPTLFRKVLALAASPPPA